MNSEQINSLFKVIDEMDCEKFAAFLDENGEFKFGNASTVKGRAEIKKAVSQFFNSIHGLQHNIKQIWSVDSCVIVNGEVTYTRKNKTQITIPFMNLLEMNNGLIKNYQIFIDISPLFAYARLCENDLHVFRLDNGLFSTSGEEAPD